MRRLTILLVPLVLAVLAGTALAGEHGPRRDFTEVPSSAQVAQDYIMVRFQDPPAASYEGGIPGLERTKPERGRFDPNSPAAQAYLKHLENEHANYRSWLARNAPRAEIVREYKVVFNGMAIKLNGEQANRVGRGPGVNAWAFSALYRPAMNVSTGLVNAPDAWDALGGPENAGEGIKVAIIDTGIDLTNPFFDDSAYPDVGEIDACPDQDGDPATPNTNNKVIVCRVYASGVALGAVQPFPALFFDHGTHVAGTVAGNFGTDGTVAGTGVEISGLSGVAPRALLGNYNVFPGFGAGFWAFGGSAFSHDIAAALEDAVLDGMDVANMSLGGGVQGPHDFLAEAANAAVDAGMIVVVAAGNSGPGDGTVESPGSAAKVITVGASTNPHFVGIPVSGTTAGGFAFAFGAALGDFANFIPAVNAEYTVTEPANGCTAITTDLTGKIALIDRGACTFTTKIRNAQAAGAIGVLIVNNVAGDPVAMGHDGTDPFPTIPAAMISKADGATIKPSGSVTVDGTAIQEFVTANADIIAGFSSRGPTPFTFLIKPDVTAPGVNVLSSVFGGEFAFFQGTSMATPHVAGAAALLRQMHPDWTPAQVKSALVNTAARVVTDHVTGTNDPGVLARGGGRIDLAAAIATPLTVDPVSASFGLWEGNKAVSATLDLTLTNVSGGPLNCSVKVSGPDIVTASADNLSLPADGTSTLTLTLDAGKADQTPSGDYDGDVELGCGGTLLRVPWWVRIDRKAKP